MDTDSLYFALSADKLEDVIKPNLKVEYENDKNNWFAWDKYSNRTPGLFKLEFDKFAFFCLDGIEFCENLLLSPGLN